MIVTASHPVLHLSQIALSEVAVVGVTGCGEGRAIEALIALLGSLTAAVAWVCVT